MAGTNLLDLINRNRAKVAQAQETEQRASEVQGGAFSTIPPGPAKIAPDAAAWVPPDAVRPQDMEVATRGQIPRLFEAGMLDVSSGVQNALAAAAQAVGADNVSAAAARSAQLDQERAAKLTPEMMTDIDEIGGEKGGIGTYIGQNMVRGLPTLGAMGLGGVLGGGLKGVAAASGVLNTGDAYGQLSAAAQTPEQRAAVPGHAFAAGGFNAILDTLGFGFAARMAPAAKLALAKSLPAHVLQSAAVEGGTGAAQQYANIVATKHLLDNPDMFGLTPEDIHALKNAAAAEASAIAPLSVGGHLAHLPGQLAGQAVEGIQNFRNRGQAAPPEGTPPEGPEGPSFTQRAGDAVGAAVGGDFTQARDLGGDILNSARENIPGVDEAINKGAEFYQRAKTAAQPGVDEFMQKARDSATPEGAVMAARQAQQMARSTADKVRTAASNAKRLWDEAQKTADPSVKKSGFGGKLTPSQLELRKTLHEIDPYVPDPTMPKAEQNRLAREHDNAHILTAKTIDSVIDDDRRFSQLLNAPGAAEMLMEQYNTTPAEFRDYLLTAVRRAKDDGREPGRGYDITDSAGLMNAGDEMAGDDAKDSAALLQPELVDMLNEHGSLNDSGERNPHMNSKKFAEFLATSKDERAGTKAGSQVRVAVVRREEGKEPEVAIRTINLMNLAKAWGAGPEGGLPGQREMSVMDKERGESAAKRNRLNVVDGLDAMLGGWEETTEDGTKVTIEIQPVKGGEKDKTTKEPAPYSVVGAKDKGVGRTSAAFDTWLPDDAVIGYDENKRPVTWGAAKDDSLANAAVSHSSALDQHYKGVSGARWAKRKYGASDAEEKRRIDAQTLGPDGKLRDNKYMTDVEMAQKAGADRAVRSIVNDILGGPDGVMMNLPEGTFQRAVNATRKFLDENYDTPIIDRLQEALRSRDKRTAILGRERDEIKVGLERAAKVALPEDLRALLDSTQNEDLSAAYEEALGYVEKGVLAAVVFMPSEIRTAGKAELISQLGRLDARANIETLSEQETSVDNPDFQTGGKAPDTEVYDERGGPGAGTYQPMKDVYTRRAGNDPNALSTREQNEVGPPNLRDANSDAPMMTRTQEASGPRRYRGENEGQSEMFGDPIAQPINTFSGEARGFTRDEEKPPYQSYEKLTKAGQEGMARTKALAAAKDNLRRLYESSEATPSNKKMLRDVRDHFGSYTTQMLTKLGDPALLMSEVRGALKPTKKIPFVGGEPKPLAQTEVTGTFDQERMRAAAKAKRERTLELMKEHVAGPPRPEGMRTPKKAEPAEAPANGGTIRKSAYSQKLHDELGNEGFAATHDSPHRFDGKFNWREHSFKGEGAQSFGAGTYLSTANGVHRSYKTSFMGKVKVRDYPIHAIDGEGLPDQSYYSNAKYKSLSKAERLIFDHYRGDIEQAKKAAAFEAQNNISYHIQDLVDMVSSMIDDPDLRTPAQQTAARELYVILFEMSEADTPADRIDNLYDLAARAGSERLREAVLAAIKARRDGETLATEIKGAAPSRFSMLPPEKPNAYKAHVPPTYHLSVNAHNHEIMDWDKPFSEQSRHVQAALESALPAKPKPIASTQAVPLDKLPPAWLAEGIKSAEVTLYAYAGDPMRVYKLQMNDDSTRYIVGVPSGGKEVWGRYPSTAAAFETIRRVSTGGALYKELSAKLGGDRAASEALQAAGIVGHRYNAGGGKNDVHPNYVIYDDRRIQTNAVEFSGAKNVGSILDTTDTVKQKELIDAIQKITGQKIGVAFDASQAHEGQYDSAKKMVTLAAMTGFSHSNAFHEAFHAVSQHYLSSDQRKTLWKAFRQGAIRQQIKKLLEHNPDAWESAKKDPEEMMAYGFQFWHADMLNFGRTPDSTVGKIFHYLLEKFNKVQDWLRDRPGAEELLKSIKDGAFADGGPSPVEIAAAKAARPNARIREVSKAIFEGLDKLYDAGVVVYDDRLRNMGNPFVDALARGLYTQVGEKTGKRGFAQEVPLQLAKRMNVLDKLARGNPRAYAQTLAEKAQGLPETNADMHKAVRGYLAEIEKYAKDAGVVMGHVEDYLPMSWDGNKIAAKRKDFIAMMKNHEMELKAVGFTPEEAADKMSQRGTATGEFVGPIFDENGAPTSDHKLDRVFTFLSNAERAPFVRDDLASSMTRYTKQMVKRAEWARNFGDDNSKWDALVEKAREYGLKKEDEELLNSYKEDAFGLRLHDMNPTARKAVELNTVYQNYRVLSLSLLSNLIDPFGVAVRSGDWGEAWNSYKLAASRMFKSGRMKHAELQELAETIGAIERAGVQDSLHQQYGGVEIEGSARIANDALFRFNGMDGLTRSVRLAALAAGTRFLKHHAGLVGKGGNPRHLDELGIKAGDIQLNAAGQLKVLKEHGLDDATSERVQAALNRFVDEAVLRPNIGERTKWGANPYLAPLYHLKQYVFSFNKVINKKLEHEFVEHDNTTPYAMASVYIPIMAMTAMLRDGITHGGELPANNGFMHYLGSGITRSGLLGPAELLELGVVGGLSGDINSVRSLAGPTADQGLDFVHAIANPHNTAVFTKFVKESLPGGNIWGHY